MSDQPTITADVKAAARAAAVANTATVEVPPPDESALQAERDAISALLDQIVTGVTAAVATPAKPGKPTNADRTAAIHDAVKQLPAVIVEYVTGASSTEYLAPMHGDPFVQDGKVYVALESRQGAARGEAADRVKGLRGYLTDRGNGLAELSKGDLTTAMKQLGFDRIPFAYNHPQRGGTFASHYWRVIDGEFADLAALDPRQSGKTERAAKRAVATSNPALVEAPVPMRPDGSPADVAKLEDLWTAYNAARAVLQRSVNKGPDARDEAFAATRSAQADLLAHRRVMVAKLPKTGANEEVTV